MRKYFYFIVEGVHDTAAIWRFLKLMNLKKIEFKVEVDKFWERTIPNNFPHNDNLLKRVPIPMFFQNEQLSIAVQNAGGDSGLVKVFSSIENIDYEKLSGIAIFCDADRRSAEERFHHLYEDLLNKLDGDLKALVEGTAFRQIKRGEMKFGIYVFPNNRDKGTLEDLLLEGGEMVYKDLMDCAKDYLTSAKEIDKDYIKKAKITDSDENKILVGVMANIIKPGKANQVSIEDNNWISKDTVDGDMQQELKSFLSEMLTSK